MRVYKIFDIGDKVIFTDNWFPARKNDEALITESQPLKIGVIYCVELKNTGQKIYLHNSESWVINKAI